MGAENDRCSRPVLPGLPGGPLLSPLFLFSRSKCDRSLQQLAGGCAYDPISTGFCRPEQSGVPRNPSNPHDYRPL